jgi:hypothetical protein
VGPAPASPGAAMSPAEPCRDAAVLRPRHEMMHRLASKLTRAATSR